MKQFKAVIFDMDGVIIDSEPSHVRAFLEVFKEMGYGENHGIHFPNYYGRSDKAVWIDFIEKHRPPQPMLELSDWKQERFLNIIRREQPIYPEIPSLVQRLAERYPLALASGSLHPVISVVVDMAGLRPCFKHLVSSQDVVHGKPAPDIFLRTAELLGVAPADCCVIEDSAAGVEAANRAGMDVIAITNTFPADRLTHATKVVTTYAEIHSALLGSA